MLIFTCLAGIPPSSPVSGRLATARGLRGCISGLRLGDEVLDILDEAEKLNLVVRGCQGRIIRFIKISRIFVKVGFYRVQI